MKTLLSLLTLSSLILSSCVTDNSYQGGDRPSNPEAITITGTVQNMSGLAVPQARVFTEDRMVWTGADGSFEIVGDQGADTVVGVEADRFLTTTRQVLPPSDGQSHLRFFLHPVGITTTISATTGGTVHHGRGEVDLPSNAFVDPYGNPVEGEVTVEATWIDPFTSALKAAPGDLSALRESGESTRLESFGMMDVTLSQDGDPVQLAEGTFATLQFDIPAEAELADGQIIPAWWFDEERGKWIEEGAGAVAVLDDGGYRWVAEVTHFTPWNCDQPIDPDDTDCIDGRIGDRDGKEMNPASSLEAVPLDWTGFVQIGSYNLDTGDFCVDIKRDSSVRIWAFDPSLAPFLVYPQIAEGRVVEGLNEGRSCAMRTGGPDDPCRHEGLIIPDAPRSSVLTPALCENASSSTGEAAGILTLPHLGLMDHPMRALSGGCEVVGAAGNTSIYCVLSSPGDGYLLTLTAPALPGSWAIGQDAEVSMRALCPDVLPSAIEWSSSSPEASGVVTVQETGNSSVDASPTINLGLQVSLGRISDNFLVEVEDVVDAAAYLTVPVAGY